jgi:hypothetical protein
VQDRKVRIQNLIAIGHDGEFSEARTRKDPIKRLKKHLLFLAKYAEKQHLKALESNNDAFELITRLTLNEFSLYTNGKPLDINQYKEIIATIADIAKELAPNIHLITASFPVLWPDGLLHNVALHVQSPKAKGQEPLLHHIDKKTPSKIDLKYASKGRSKHALFSLREQTAYPEAQYSPDTVLKNTAISVNDVNQKGGAIKIISAAGNSFLVAIDICAEHGYAVGITDTKRLMQQLKEAGETVPEKGTHVVSAKSVYLKKNYLIGSVTVADPLFLKAASKLEIYEKPKFGDAMAIHTYSPTLVKPLKNENLKQAEQIQPYDRLKNDGSSMTWPIDLSFFSKLFTRNATNNKSTLTANIKSETETVDTHSRGNFKRRSIISSREV